MDVFDYLSKLRKYNGIIVIQNHYLIDQDYSTPIKVIDVDTGMKLVV
jgi:dUTPase